MGKVHTFLAKIVIFLLHAWITIERVVIKWFFKSQVKEKVIDFYRLDTENRGLVQVNNPEFYIHAANKSLLGFCESYMKGWISITKIDEVVANILKSGKLKKDIGFKYKAFLDYLEFDLFEIRNNNLYYDQCKLSETHLFISSKYH